MIRVPIRSIGCVVAGLLAVTGCPDDTPISEEPTDTDQDDDGYIGSAHGGNDCKDTDADTHPGAPEICDGLDNDCDGHLDCDDPDALDADGDGTCECDDCDEADPLNYPGNTELCDDQDNDCDGAIDEGVAFTNWYPDNDGDDWGNTEDVQSSCDGPPFEDWIEIGDDCDDSDPDIHPDAVEACDGIDNDCDEDVDEDFWGAQTGTLMCIVDPASPECADDAVAIGETDGVLDLDMSDLAGVTIVLHTDTPTGYAWHVADSPSNDTGCGDGSVHSHDSEIYLVDDQVVLCSQDQYGWYEVLDDLVSENGAGWLEISVSPGFVRVLSGGLCAEYGQWLFPLSGWDEQAGADDDQTLHIGLNRVVLADSDRTGTGLTLVELYAWP